MNNVNAIVTTCLFCLFGTLISQAETQNKSMARAIDQIFADSSFQSFNKLQDVLTASSGEIELSPPVLSPEKIEQYLSPRNRALSNKSLIDSQFTEVYLTFRLKDGTAAQFRIWDLNREQLNALYTNTEHGTRIEKKQYVTKDEKIDEIDVVVPTAKLPNLKALNSILTQFKVFRYSSGVTKGRTETVYLELSFPKSDEGTVHRNAIQGQSIPGVPETTHK